MHTHLKQAKRGHVFGVPNLDPSVQVFWLGKTAMIQGKVSMALSWTWSAIVRSAGDNCFAGFDNNFHLWKYLLLTYIDPLIYDSPSQSYMIMIS